LAKIVVASGQIEGRNIPESACRNDLSKPHYRRMATVSLNFICLQSLTTKHSIISANYRYLFISLNGVLMNRSWICCWALTLSLFVQSSVQADTINTEPTTNLPSITEEFSSNFTSTSWETNNLAAFSSVPQATEYVPGTFSSFTGQPIDFSASIPPDNYVLNGSTFSSSDSLASNDIPVYQLESFESSPGLLNNSMIPEPSPIIGLSMLVGGVLAAMWYCNKL
jgi:hypothetical protein